MIAWMVLSSIYAQEPAVIEPKIVSAVILKNGTSLIVREAPILAGKREYRIESIPDSYDGSFWYGSPDGAEISDAVTTLRYAKKRVTRSVKGFGELLYANIGKNVRMRVRSTPTELEWLDGVLEQVPELVLRKGDIVHFVSISSIVELDTSTLTTKEWSTEIEVPEQAISFTADAKKPSRLRFLSLESGAAWSGSYLVTLKDSKTAGIDGKAQLALGGKTFDDVHVSLLAGLPKLPSENAFDLAAGIGSLREYLSGRQYIVRSTRTRPEDPYVRLRQVMEAADRALQATMPMVGGFAGGFGGGGFGGYGGNPQQPQDEEFNTSRPAENTAAAQVEDVFSYDFGAVSLKPGDRLTRPLFHVESTYDMLFAWDAKAGTTVRKILRITNKGGVPFTPGTCLVMKDGQFLGETQMPYTSKADSANIDLGGVIDVPVSRVTEMVSTEKLEERIIPPRYRVTMQDRFGVENARDEDIDVEIRSEVTGKITDAGGAAVAVLDWLYSSGQSLRQSVTWKLRVPAHQRKEVKVVYELIRNS